jgi:hypothetical protein
MDLSTSCIFSLRSSYTPEMDSICRRICFTSDSNLGQCKSYIFKLFKDDVAKYDWWSESLVLVMFLPKSRRYYLFPVHLIFILPSSHSNDEEKKKNPQPHLPVLENPQEGADDKPKTASEILQKKTRTILTVLYYLIQYLRYALYCIALEMEEIHYLYLYLYLYLYTA